MAATRRPPSRSELYPLTMHRNGHPNDPLPTRWRGSGQHPEAPDPLIDPGKTRSLDPESKIDALKWPINDFLLARGITPPPKRHGLMVATGPIRPSARPRMGPRALRCRPLAKARCASAGSGATPFLTRADYPLDMRSAPVPRHGNGNTKTKEQRLNTDPEKR